MQGRLALNCGINTIGLRNASDHFCDQVPGEGLAVAECRGHPRNAWTRPSAVATFGGQADGCSAQRDANPRARDYRRNLLSYCYLTVILQGSTPNPKGETNECSSVR